MSVAPPDRRAIITEALRKINDLTARLEIAEKGDTEPIAVVGMGCRFPGGVGSPAQYWRFLQDGASGIVQVPSGRWDADAFYSDDHSTPGTICSREGGFLTSWRPDEFDAEFFGISPREAAAMDPQQRLLLEVAWEALENAGITASAIRNSQTSVFVGSTTYDYSLIVANVPLQELDPHIPFGNAANFAAGRLAYFLGVHGPAVVIDTACSSSLVAIHLACQSLRRRESDQALAAGVNLMLTPLNSVATSRWGMLAPDGRCKTFDADANGYVRSEGCGLVVLKRLGDALRDGDSVLAVVRGSAVNQDGPSSGQTVPSGPAQQAVLRAALAAARLGPSEVDYIEAHGTGTALGDPIELGALDQVFGDRNGSAPLVLGSVKTNLGHLESAAGIAGFIKTVLSVQHGYIPRHLHFSKLTPNAVEGAARFTIAAEGMSWPVVRRARRAGVSSFGVSGTNAHVVVEQAPAPESLKTPAPQSEPVISTLVVSGKSPARIASTAAMLADWMVGEGAEVSLADVAHTVNHHRTQYKTFATVCARDRAQAVAGLQALAAGDSAIGVVGAHEGLCKPGTVFVYSGQGSQWPGMGRQLLADEPAFAAAVDELEPQFVEQVGFSLRQVLAEGQPVAGDARVQPVLVGLQLALTALWRSYGVEPAAVIGHSVGEVTAAVVAGALSPADGLKVIVTRSRLMSQLAGQGAVALLELDADATEKLIADFHEVSLAGYLSPRQTVIAGSVAQVDAVIAAVAAQERFARRVNMEVASHTALMDPILPELRSALADLTPGTPTIPFISTVADSDVGAGAPLLDASYWVANVRQPVRLRQAISTAAEQHATFIEISPHPTLTHAVAETLESTHHHSIGTLSRDGDDTVSFHTNLNSSHVAQPPQLPHPPEPHPVLPSTPWHHTQHWMNVETHATAAESVPRPGTLLGGHVAVTTTPPTHLWQARLAPSTKPYPGYHQNHGVELVPVSVLLQTLSAAAAECDASILSNIRFDYPIVVDEPRVIQVVADGDSVSVSSSLVAEGATRHWVGHVSARIIRPVHDHQVEGLADAVAGGGAKDTEFVDQSVTSLWRAWGSEGRPFEWSIGSCRSAAGSLHADVELSKASAVALLDAAIHIARLLDSSNPRLMVPAAVARVRFEAELADQHGRIEVHRRGGNDDELIVDIAVKAPDGSTCIDIRALRYTAVDSSSAASRSDDPRAMVHEIEWRPFESHAESPEVTDDPGTLAVVGSDGRNGTASHFADAGYPSATVADARYVLYVAESRPDEADLDCAVRMSLEVADLVRRLAERDDNHPVTLWIITRGVREGISHSAVAQSCLWGTAGVIRAEQPQLWGGLVDIPPDEDISDCLSAVLTILHTPAKSILSLRDGELFVPAPVPVSGEPVRDPFRCRPDAAYLITGGMGALGLLMAGWLADHGARRVVLAGRTPLPPRRDWDSHTNDADTRHKVAAIRALELRGVSVEAVALDVGSRDAVQALLAKRDADGAAPIHGIIHGAGITDAQLLTEIEESRLRRTMWPKIAGAQVLHETFPPGSLDFLFLTAAAGAVFGVPGQGAYAAANAYLDGLARARHRQGCHTVSLDWVAWRGLGFGADAQIALQELERLGSRPVTPDEAFAAWDHLERYDVSQAVMAPLPSSDVPAESDQQARSPAWSQMAAQDVLSELEAGLRAILARELRMSEAELDLNRPFAELGLNSVMAMSVRRETEQFVGIELSATMLFNHPTIVTLAAYLAKKLLPHSESDDDIDQLGDSASSVLNELFDSVESAPAGSERGI
jgi:phthiocerol/phenolphthiocerol synthesis type-I polyketide synthase A